MSDDTIASRLTAWVKRTTSRVPARQLIVAATAVATFANGALDLYSLIHPAMPARLAFLYTVLPIEFVRLSRFTTLVVGFALVIASLNIYKRKRRALQAVLVLASLSIVFQLTKGIDFEEASLSLLLIGLLVVGRRHFSVRSGPPDMESAVLRLGITLAIGIAYGVAGFWFLDPREFGIDFSLGEAVQNTLRALVLSGDPRVVPHTRHAVWFLDSLPLMTALMVSYSIALLFRPVLYRLRTVRQERAAATDIVRQHVARDDRLRAAHACLAGSRGSPDHPSRHCPAQRAGQCRHVPVLLRACPDLVWNRQECRNRFCRGCLCRPDHSIVGARGSLPRPLRCNSR